MFVTWISFRGTFQSFLDLTEVSAQSWYKVRTNDSVNPTFKISLLQSFCDQRTPEERLPPGGPKDEFGRMIFEKKSSLEDRTKVQSRTSAGARGGEAWRWNV